MHTDAAALRSPGAILSYCLYAVPFIATTAAIGNFVAPYYSETLGLSLPVIASCLLAIRIIDAVCDPFIGLAVDRAPFRRKHRPWLAITLPIYLAGIGLLFFPPASLVGPAYLIAVGGVVYVAYTLGMVVHQAWAASLTNDPAELSRLFGYRELAVIAGILGVFGFAAITARLFGSDIASQARAAGGFIIVAMTLCTAVTYFLTPDPKEAGGARKPASWSELRPLLASRNFVWLCLAMVSFNFAWIATSAMGFFVATHLFRSPGSFALGLTVSFCLAPLGMAVWMKLARRMGDRSTLILSCVLLALVLLSLPVAARFGTAGFFAFHGMIGLCFGAGPYLIRSITGRIANDHVARTGAEVRGAAFAVATFFDKLGSGLGASALFPLAWLGFNPAAPESEGARHALTMVASLGPALGFVLTAIFIFSVRLGTSAGTKTHPMHA